jgi:putative FmdB family regulatory protein
MPFYEYQCSACGRVSEVMQKFSDPPLKKCPSCGKARLQKLVSAPVFRLKGSGWYETDFKGDSDKKRNLVGADAEPAAPAAAEAKTDAKTDAKAETKAETPAKPAESKAEPTAASRSASKDKSAQSAARRPAAKKAPARKPVVKKTGRR